MNFRSIEIFSPQGGFPVLVPDRPATRPGRKKGLRCPRCAARRDEGGRFDADPRRKGFWTCLSCGHRLFYRPENVWTAGTSTKIYRRRRTRTRRVRIRKKANWLAAFSILIVFALVGASGLLTFFLAAPANRETTIEKVVQA
ncbi:MAG: hypothetical protein HZA50_11740 [Planctomycetes bacterium]|nr:hypothetical protein [Planctomycetota bacterium]